MTFNLSPENAKSFIFHIIIQFARQLSTTAKAAATAALTAATAVYFPHKLCPRFLESAKSDCDSNSQLFFVFSQSMIYYMSFSP